MAFVKRNVRWQPILVVLLVSALLLVALDQRGSGPITAVRRVAREVISPFQTGVNSVFNPVRDLFDGVINYGQLRDRNLDLKRKNEVLQGKLLRERAVGSKVGELEKLLDLPTFEDATGVAARVVGGSPSNFERTVSINKGTSSGIQVGQPVVAGAEMPVIVAPSIPTSAISSKPVSGSITRPDLMTTSKVCLVGSGNGPAPLKVGAK